MQKIVVDAGPLPKSFEDLQPLVRDWAIPSPQDRVEKRLTTPMEDIQAFYAAMTARLPAVLEFLRGHLVTAMPADVRRLYLLTLALAQIYPCVENFGQADVVDGWEMRKFPIIEA